MDLNGLWNIANDFFTNEEIKDIWYNNKEIKLKNHKDFLLIDYTVFGFKLKRGRISSTGIKFEFTKKNYDLSVQRLFSNFNRDFFDSVLLTPNYYTQAHFDARKSKTIRQTAKDIRTTNDFIKLQKSIEKHFPFN